MAVAALDVAPDPAGYSLVLWVPGDGGVRALKVLLNASTPPRSRWTG